MDDYHNKMKNERQEKEIKITQYEEEIARIRSTIGEKDTRIEELESTQHTHRKTVLSLQEKIEQFESENTELKNRMEIEASHRKRLEHRMRSMLTTAEMNDINGGISSMPPRSRGGMFPSTTGDSLYGGSNSEDIMYHNNGPSGSGSTTATLMMPNENMSSGSNGRLLSARSGMSSSSYNTLPLHGGVASNMPSSRPQQGRVATQNTYGVETDNMSHSSAGSHHYQSNNRANHSDYYNMDLESTSVVTSNSAYNSTSNTSYRTEPFRQSAAMDGAMLSARGPNSNYMTNEDLMGFNNASPAQGSGLSFNSPPRNQHSQMQSSSAAIAASSPAVDRVSAALALKVAQQNRMLNSNSSNTNNASVSGGNPNMLRHSSANRLLDDDLAQEFATASSGGGGGGGNSVVEESIRRTQMVINRRLGLDLQSQQPSSTIHETPKASSAINVAAGTEKTPNSGRSNSSSKLHDTIQQAHSLYPSSPSNRRLSNHHDLVDDNEDNGFADGANGMEDEDDDDANASEYNLDESVSRFLMPSSGVRPISPPPLYTGSSNPGPVPKGVGGKKKKKKKSSQQLPKI